jgi:hypothetical protein
LVPKFIEQYRRVIKARSVDVEVLQRKLEDLRGKKDRLVESHLANPVAVPLDVLEVKQVKLGDELKAVEEQLRSAAGDSKITEDNVRRSSVLLTALPEAYRRAGSLFRRQMNQAYFLKVFVGREGVKGAMLTPECEALTREGFAARLDELAGKRKLDFGPGSTERELVALIGALLNHQQALDRLNGIRKKLVREGHRSSRSSPQIRARSGAIPPAIIEVLAASSEPMHVREVHQAVERKLKTKISKHWLNCCLSTATTGDHPLFERIGYGLYRLR